MLIKEAQRCRQSPLQKAAAWGENALRVVGTARGMWEAGKTVVDAGRAAVGFAQSVAPYAQAAATALL